MTVTLIDFTGKHYKEPAHYAAALLVFAKQTRLEMDPNRLGELLNAPMAHLEKELNTIARTIPSSWEFIDYTWMVTGVTRAFTHQFVRTRHASFAQQTMRVLNVSDGPGWTYGTGPTIKENEEIQRVYDESMAIDDAAYRKLISLGAAIEDARGVLPTNIHTNILVKMNMRTLVEMTRKRSSSRVQGEYREVLEQLKATAVQRHPWLTIFLDRTADQAAHELEAMVLEHVGDKATSTNMVKLIDRLRGEM